MSKLSEYLGAEGFEAPEDDGFDGEYTLLPTAWYPVEITKVKIKDNANGSGARFVVEFTIFGEKYAGRKVWNGAGFNFIHTSQQCQAIGQQQLGKLTRACGYGENDRLRDEDELLNKQLDVFVETKAGTGEYKDSNVATKFATLGTGGKKEDSPAKPAQPPVAYTPPQQAQAQTSSGVQQSSPAPAQTPAGGSKRPWER